MSTNTPGQDHPVDLPERAQALLDGWPAPERGALEWEDTASRTMRRVHETAIGSTPDDLLGAPLPPESGEGNILPEPPEEEPMLASIARSVVAKAHDASSNAVAREMLLAAEDQRRSAPPAPPPGALIATGRAASGSAEGRAASRSAAAPPSEARSVEAIHESTARSELPEPSRRERDRRGGAGMFALGAGAALALAAGAALYVSARSPSARNVLTEPSADAHAGASRPMAATVNAPAPAASVAAADGVEGDPHAHAIALDVLPPVPETPKTEAAPAKAEPAATGATKDSLAFRVKSAPPGPGKLVLEERDDEPTPTQANAAPVAAGGTSRKEAAEPEPGTPSQPSLGAIQAAVGAVMSGARSCLAGQDTGSKATLKFSPSGRVTSVAISGPAAGTPAESCVRSALQGARVPPFSDPSFSASLTIRPP